MIQSTKRDQYWSFLLPQGEWNHPVFEEKRALDVAEATEVSEAARSMRLHRYLRPLKSLLNSSESAKSLNLII
jgi:hypothetical protein